MVTKEAACKELEFTLYLLKDWISATSPQLSAKEEEAHLMGSLEHCKVRRADTRSDNVGHKRYSIGMAEKMKTASGIGDFGRPFRRIYYASDGSYEPEFVVFD